MVMEHIDKLLDGLDPAVPSHLYPLIERLEALGELSRIENFPE
jgi:hypothetical protein